VFPNDRDTKRALLLVPREIAGLGPESWNYSAGWEVLPLPVLSRKKACIVQSGLEPPVHYPDKPYRCSDNLASFNGGLGGQAARPPNSSANVCTTPCPKLANGSNRWCRAPSITMRYQETSIAWGCYGIGCSGSGGIHSAAEARNARSPGRVPSLWLNDGFLIRECSILIPLIASPPVIRDKNRMR
jgi:hypothetical protein